MRPDGFQRRQPVVGLGHHLDRPTRRERPDHPVAKQRMVVTHHHAHLFAGHEASVAQHRPVLPPIGGHVIHPCRRLIAGQTRGPRCGSLESSPEHTGARQPKSQRRQKNSHVQHHRSLPRPPGRLGRHLGGALAWPVRPARHPPTCSSPTSSRRPASRPTRPPTRCRAGTGTTASITSRTSSRATPADHPTDRNPPRRPRGGLLYVWRLPPIGGHRIPPVQPPIARQTSPTRCERVISRPEKTGSRTENPHHHRRIQK